MTERRQASRAAKSRRSTKAEPKTATVSQSLARPALAISCSLGTMPIVAATHSTLTRRNTWPRAMRVRAETRLTTALSRFLIFRCMVVVL